LPLCCVWHCVVTELEFLRRDRPDDRRYCASTVVNCRARALFLADNRHSRGSGGGGSRAISPSASSLLHRPAHNLHRTGIRDTVVGGCARAHSLFRSSLRLSDSRGGGGLTSKLGDEYVAYAKRTKRLIPYVL